MRGSDLSVLLPLALAAGAVVLYFVARALPAAHRRWTGLLAGAILLGAFGPILHVEIRDHSLHMAGMTLQNASHLGVILGLLATAIGAAACIFSVGRIDPAGPVQIYYPLMVFAVAGVVAVSMARDLFTLFVMVELSSVPSYALVAYGHRRNPNSLPAALKYLVQGVAGTLTALMGVAILWLTGGSLHLDELPRSLATAGTAPLALAAAFILVGYGVKLAVVPLHTWLPDAYCEAPAAVTAVMTGATKAGALVALFLCLASLPPAAASGPAALALGPAILFLAVLTMTVGNLMALGQKDLRRVLAYSSVAQMGYILLGFGLGRQYGAAAAVGAGLFYLLAYSVMKAGAFLGADLLAASAGSSTLEGVRGAGARHPVLGIAFAVFILGLIGVPATAGFPGKLMLFQAGMGAGTAWGVALALLLAVNSAVSLGYYGPVLTKVLFGGAPEGGGHAAAPVPAPEARPLPFLSTAVVAAMAAATVGFGLFPGPVFEWLGSASQTLLPGGSP